MLGRTHISIGLAALTYTMPTLTFPAPPNGQALLTFGAAIAAVVLGSLAPDLDQPGSTLSRDIAGPFGMSRIMALIGGIGALYLNQRFHIHPLVTLAGIILLVMALIKHRGITHSIFGLMIAGYGMYMVQENDIYIHYIGVSILTPFLLGYGLHIIADILAGGVSLLYPFVKKTVRIPFFSIRTGSLIDRIVVNYTAFTWAVFHFVRLSLKLG